MTAGAVARRVAATLPDNIQVSVNGPARLGIFRQKLVNVANTAEAGSVVRDDLWRPGAGRPVFVRTTQRNFRVGEDVPEAVDKARLDLAAAVSRAEKDKTVKNLIVPSLSENDTLVAGRTTLTVTDSFADGKTRHYLAETSRLPPALQEVAAAAQAVVEASSRHLRASTEWMNLNPLTP